MKVPDEFKAGQEKTGGAFSRAAIKRPRISSLPFDVIELIENEVAVFTVPDQEHYRIIRISYYARAAGTFSIRATPSGETRGAKHLLYSSALAISDEGSAASLEGHFFGPGEELSVLATGSGATINVKVSAERITGGYDQVS